LVTTDIETLITALYVTTDDELAGLRFSGRPPRLSASEPACLAVAQALLRFASEARWLRYAHKHLAGWAGYGYCDTLKAQLDLEFHGGRTSEGVAIRVAQRITALAAAIWHNNKTGAPITRSLIAYDH
jgi:hypothetical protein